MTDELLPGSTITPTGTVTPKVQSNEVVTQEISISGASANGITHDPNSTDRSKLASAFAVKLGLTNISQEVEELSADFNKIFFSPVLSDPIADPYFQGTEWNSEGFVFQDSTAIFTKTSNNTNAPYVRLTADAFYMTGVHFIYIKVKQLDAGIFKIKNHHDEILLSAIIPGTYALEVSIDQPSIAYLDFIVEGLNTNQTCTIECIYAHYVKTAFSRYMSYMAEHLLSGGSGFASTTYVDTHLQSMSDVIYTYVNLTRDNIYNNLTLHLGDNGNPHNVNYAQVGAAPLSHTHTPGECSSAPVIHTHTPVECGAAAILHTHTWSDISDITVITNRILTLEQSVSGSTVGSDLTLHLNDLTNPHEVTYSQVGAAAAVHTHTPVECSAAPVIHTHFPSECGAAALDHSHEVSDITNMNVVTDRIVALEDANANNTTNAALVTHINNTNNPHSTTKDQVGLDLVENASMATDLEAISGTARDKYINPANVKAVVSQLSNQTLWETTKLIPTPIGIFDFNSMGQTIEVPIFKDRLYQMSINCFSGCLKSIGIAIEDTVNTNIRNSVQYQKTINVDGTDISIMGIDQSKDNHFKLMSTTSGINFAKGELTLDTNNFTLTGTMYGLLVDNFGNEMIDKSFPFTISSGYVKDEEPVNVTKLILYSNDNSTLDARIIIYELLQTTQEPVLVVDATPVGIIATRYGSELVPGWGLIDGSELSRLDYPELYKYAVDTNSIVVDSTWQNEVSANGFTMNFSYGNEVDTFKLPKDLVTISPEKRYIKLKYTQVPSGDEILYRFIWEN